MVLLLSWDAHLDFRDRVTVATITSQIRGLHAEVFLDEADGLQHRCVVNLDTISTILRTDLQRVVSRLSEVRMLAVERAIHRALGIDLPCRLG